MEHWNNGTIEQWNNRKMEQWNNGKWNNIKIGTIQQCNNVTM